MSTSNQDAAAPASTLHDTPASKRKSDSTHTSPHDDGNTREKRTIRSGSTRSKSKSPGRTQTKLLQNKKTSTTSSTQADNTTKQQSKQIKQEALDLTKDDEMSTPHKEKTPSPPPPPTTKTHKKITSTKSTLQTKKKSQTSQTLDPVFEQETKSTSTPTSDTKSNRSQSPGSSSMRSSKYQTSNSKTKVQSNLNGAVMNRFRYSLNFDLKPEQKGTAGLREALIDIFSQIKEYAKDAVILQWKVDDIKNPIKSPDKIPETITQLQQYFNNARTYDSGGQVYSKVHLGFPVKMDHATFYNDIRGKFKGTTIRFNINAVQHHNVRTVCWLPYLPRSVCPDRTSRRFSQAFRDTYKRDIPIGIVWRALNGQRNVDVKNRIYAYHVEAPSGNRDEVKRFLRACSAQKKYPGGTRFRVMSEYFQYMSDEHKKKYRYMSSKHKYFLDLIGTCVNAQIVDPDKRIPGTSTTLRHILLSLRDKEDNHRIFNSVDVQWNDSTQYVLTFRPDKTSMAYAYSNSVSTYVRHLYPNSDLSQVFTLEAIDRAKEESYHPNDQKFTTQEDIAMQREIDNDRDDDSLDYIPEDELPSMDDDLDEAPVREIGNIKVFNLSGETDTVSTMANDAASVTFHEEVSYHEIPTSNSNASTEQPQNSAQSIASQDSANTRITRVEESSMQVRSDVAALRADFSKVMTALSSLTGTSLQEQPATSADDKQAAATE